MINCEKKVNKFVQAILQYAQEQRSKIHLEADALKAERLQKAEQEVLTDAYRLIQNENAAVRYEIVREISRRDLASRKEMIFHRQKIADDIFISAKEKLKEFVSTPEYEQYMIKMIGDMALIMSPQDTIYYISQRDEHFLKSLVTACPAGSRVEISENIDIGGIRGVDTKNKQIIDNTLDTKLEQQREWFATTSGLCIE